MSQPESTEKMQIVIDSLRANPDLVVVGGIEKNYLTSGEWPTPSGYWSHTLDIYTHPKDPMYDAAELNNFMNGLVPELKPTNGDAFYGGRKQGRGLELGKLYYNENIGTAVLSATVELRDDISIVRHGLVATRWIASQTFGLKQHTRVRVFPDAGHLADAAEGENAFSIPLDELGRRGDGHVVASLFQTPLLGGFVAIENS